MLWILYKRKYRNAEKLEKYIEWLREQVQQHGNQNLAETRLRDFDAHKGWTAEQVRADSEAGKITQAEARYLRFMGAWSTARHASNFVLNNKVTDARLDNIYMTFKNALEGEELHVPDIDEVEIRMAGLKEQADKLREFVGNPFEFEREEDFYYGRGQIG